jgi:uncharacterized YccA/Bax inhibitor family protein
MNPALGNKTFTHAGFAEQTMTVNGVINKSFFLWLILAVGAYLGWSYPAITAPLMIPIIIGTLILSIVTIFKKNISPFTSPVYAFFEGCCWAF